MSNLKIGLLATCVNLYYSVWPNLKQELESILKNEIIRRIKKFGDIVYPGFVVDDIKSAKKAGEELHRQNVDIVLIVEMNYSFSEVLFTAVKCIKKPIILLSTQLLSEVDANISFKELITGNCIVGNSEITSVLKRVGIDYYVVSGLMNKDSTYKELGDYFKAIEVTKKLKDLNIDLIGSTPYPGMMDIMVDETFISNKFGSKIVYVGINDIVRIFNSVKQEEIEKFKKEISAKYKNIFLSPEQFEISSKMTVCFKKIAKEYCLGSIALYCQPIMYNRELGISPDLAAVILNTKGIPVSAEGDVATAISMFIMNELTGNTTCAEQFILDYKKNAILLGHKGNGNLNFARNYDDIKIKPHPRLDGAYSLGAVAEFSAKEGKATILNMSPDSDSRWKMVISSGKIINFGSIKDWGSPHLWFKIDMNLDDYIRRWFSAGSSHHLAVSYGEVEETLAKIGSLLDLNVSIIK